MHKVWKAEYFIWQVRVISRGLISLLISFVMKFILTQTSQILKRRSFLI